MIEGTIVNLRAPDMGDLERNHGWMNDREVTRFLGGRSRYLLSMAAEEAWLRGRCEQQMSYAHAFFAIETKEGRHIGNTDLFNAAAEERRAELGIMIGEKDDEGWHKMAETTCEGMKKAGGECEVEIVKGAGHVFKIEPKKLFEWIEKNIAREAIDSFSAVDVLRERRAECQGHSYLLAALARALGIPARIVNGIVYSEPHGGFLYHTWNELWIEGRGWRPVDATFGQAHADATHLKLVEGETPAELLPLATLVGRIRVASVSALGRW